MYQNTIENNYYYKAFSGALKTEWKGFENVANNNVEIKNLAYYRALTCFIKNDIEAVENRRTLLYSYLSKVFDAYKPTSSINNNIDTNAAQKF